MTIMGRLIGLMLVMMLAGVAAPAASQAWPNRSVTIVVPYAAGGGSDAVTRLVAQKLTERLGQSFVVENRLGAGGLIASSYVAKAPADGYTLLLGTDAQLAIQVTLRKSLPYDPMADFVPVAMVGNAPFGLIVNSALPAKSVTEFIALAKSKPGELSFGSSGTGGVPHLLAELFMSMTGTKMTHIPYKGTAQALNDIAAGRVPMTFSGLVPVMGLLNSGQIRVLGVTSTRRVPAVPDAPVISEAGVPGFVAVAWLMIVAPARTPMPIVERLHNEIDAIARMPDVQAQFEKVGYFPPDAMPQPKLAGFVKSEIDRWGKVITDAGLARSQ